MKFLQYLFIDKIKTKVLDLFYNGYLVDTGWIMSLQKNQSIDKHGEPLPWLTYPLIELLKDRVDSNFTILEFGSGWSTLFFSQKLKEITSIEDNKEWYEFIKKKINENVNLIYCDGTQTTIENILPTINKSFDIVLLDGFDRRLIATHSSNFLNEGGIVILDDSEREEYYSIKDYYKATGYKRLDFWGMAAFTSNKKCTSIFYKADNCFNL